MGRAPGRGPYPPGQGPGTLPSFPNINGSFGVDASGHALIIGLGVGFGGAVDTNGTWCIYANGSFTFGIGFFAGAGATVGVTQGFNKTGFAGSGGFFLEGGGGIAEGAELNFSEDGVGGVKGFGGIGIGGAGGFRETGTAMYCFNEPKGCNR